MALDQVAGRGTGPDQGWQGGGKQPVIHLQGVVVNRYVLKMKVGGDQETVTQEL